MKQLMITLVSLLCTIYADLTPIFNSQIHFKYMSVIQDQMYLIISSPYNNIYQFNLTNNTFSQMKQYPSSYFSAMSSNSQYLFVGDIYLNYIYQFSNDLKYNQSISESKIFNVFASDDTYLYIVTDNTIEVWDATSMNKISQATVGPVYTMTYFGNSVYLYDTNNYASIEERDIFSLSTIKHTFTWHQTDYNYLLVYNGSLFSGGADNNIVQWSLISHSQLQQFISHTDQIITLTASGEYLFSASYDYTWKQWDIGSGLLIRTETPYNQNINGMYVYGSYLYVAGDGGLVQYQIPELVPNVTTTTTTTTNAVTSSTTTTTLTSTTTMISTTSLISTTKSTTTTTGISTTTTTTTSTSTRTTTTSPTTTHSTTLTTSITSTPAYTTTPTPNTNTTTPSGNQSNTTTYSANTLTTQADVNTTTEDTKETIIMNPPTTKENSNTSQSQNSNIGYYVGAPLMALVLLIATIYFTLHFIKKKKEENEEKATQL